MWCLGTTGPHWCPGRTGRAVRLGIWVMHGRIATNTPTACNTAVASCHADHGGLVAQTMVERVKGLLQKPATEPSAVKPMTC